MTDPSGRSPGKQGRYRWPWLLLAAILLAIALAVLWMSREIARIRRSRDFNPPATTNPGATSSGQKPLPLPHRA